MLLTSSGRRPAMLPNALQCTGRPLQQRMMPSQMFRVLGLRNSELNSSHSIHKESQSKRPHRCRENKRPNCLPSRWLGGWTAILTVQHDVEKHRREDTIRVIECSDWHIVSGSINGHCYCGLNPVHFDAWLPNWEAHLICPLAMNKSIKDSQKKKKQNHFFKSSFVS